MLEDQQMKRFEYNDPTKVLKNDCVSLKEERKWLIFICPKILLWMNFFMTGKDFHTDRLFVSLISFDDFSL